LTELWSINLVATAIETPPELNFGQGVFYSVLQSLCYNLADMHKINPNIHEVIAFTKWLSVGQIVRNVPSVKSVLYRHIWTLGTNTYLALNFM
jgi:hypothetical protein